jgi:hypothetical protein
LKYNRDDGKSELLRIKPDLKSAEKLTEFVNDPGFMEYKPFFVKGDPSRPGAIGYTPKTGEASICILVDKSGGKLQNFQVENLGKCMLQPDLDMVEPFLHPTGKVGLLGYKSKVGVASIWLSNEDKPGQMIYTGRMRLESGYTSIIPLLPEFATNTHMKTLPLAFYSKESGDMLVGELDADLLHFLPTWKDNLGAGLDKLIPLVMDGKPCMVAVKNSAGEVTVCAPEMEGMKIKGCKTLGKFSIEPNPTAILRAFNFDK